MQKKSKRMVITSAGILFLTYKMLELIKINKECFNYIDCNINTKNLYEKSLKK